MERRNDISQNMAHGWDPETRKATFLTLFFVSICLIPESDFDAWATRLISLIDFEENQHRVSSNERMKAMDSRATKEAASISEGNKQNRHSYRPAEQTSKGLGHERKGQKKRRRRDTGGSGSGSDDEDDDGKPPPRYSRRIDELPARCKAFACPFYKSGEAEYRRCKSISRQKLAGIR